MLENLAGYEKTTLEIIRDKSEKMPRIQRMIALYMLNNAEQIVQCSISDIARFSGAKSEASIVRFYRSLGFDGYKDFKLKIAQELAGRTLYHSYEDIKLDDSVKDLKRKIFSGAMMTLTANLALDDNAAYEAATELIMKANRIILLGYAASAAICYYAHFRFIELGLVCHFSPDSHINAALLTQPNPGDLIFCISFSGETRDVITPITSIPRGSVKIVSLTRSEESTLAKLSDVVIVTHTDETNLVVDAMNARISQMCSIDSLFSMVSLAKGSAAFERLMRTRRTFYDYKK